MSTPPTLEPQTPVTIQIEIPEITKETETAPMEVADSIKCNCFAYVKHAYYPDLPSTSYILSHLEQEVGEVIVFYYPQVGLYHYAKVVSRDGDMLKLDESNYHFCKVGTRVISTTDPSIIGYFNP